MKNQIYFLYFRYTIGIIKNNNHHQLNLIFACFIQHLFVYLLSNFLYKMTKTNLIYGLRDGRNDAYFYIGKTTIGVLRPLKHLVKSHNKDVNDLVKTIYDSGNSVKVDILETDIDLDFLCEREKYWIKYYSEIYDIVNVMLIPNEAEEYVKIQNIDLTETNRFLDLLKNAKDIVSQKRKYLRITQKTLSEMSNLNRSTITQIEKGESTTIASLISVLTVLSSIEKQNNKIKLL